MISSTCVNCVYSWTKQICLILLKPNRDLKFLSFIHTRLTVSAMNLTVNCTQGKKYGKPSSVGTGVEWLESCNELKVSVFWYICNKLQNFIFNFLSYDFISTDKIKGMGSAAYQSVLCSSTRKIVPGMQLFSWDSSRVRKEQGRIGMAFWKRVSSWFQKDQRYVVDEWERGNKLVYGALTRYTILVYYGRS